MFGATQQLYSDSNLHSAVSTLRTGYSDPSTPAAPDAAPPPPAAAPAPHAMNWTPWLIGGVVVAGGLYLLLRE